MLYMRMCENITNTCIECDLFGHNHGAYLKKLTTSTTKLQRYVGAQLGTHNHKWQSNMIECVLQPC